MYKSLFYHLQAPFNLHERSEVKGIKKGIKPFTCRYRDGRACVCLSVCQSVWITKLNNFWLNKRILIKFSGPRTLQVNFGQGCNQLTSKVQPWAKNVLFLENLSPPWVFVLQGCDIYFGNLRTWAKKSREQKFEFQGSAQNVVAWMGGYTPFWGIWSFYIK
jgi:hypothetical protein